jgi:hypothetical protein
MFLEKARAGYDYDPECPDARRDKAAIAQAADPNGDVSMSIDKVDVSI